MRRGSILLLVMLPLLVCQMEGCSRNPSPRLRPLPDDGVILAFGDSITYGTGAGSGEGYPSRLQEMVGINVVNRGVPEEEIARGLERLPHVLEEIEPDLVILCHGGNDILRGRGAEEIQANLEEMVQLIQASGADVVLIAVPVFSFGLKDAPYYRQVAEKFSIPCLEGVLSRILGNSRLKADMVHPNADGYAILAEELKRTLEQSGALGSRDR